MFKLLLSAILGGLCGGLFAFAIIFLIAAIAYIFIKPFYRDCRFIDILSKFFGL